MGAEGVDERGAEVAGCLRVCEERGDGGLEKWTHAD